MAFTAAPRRFRGSKKRIQRIRFTSIDKWLALLLVLLCLLSMAAGGWLGFIYKD